MLQNLKVTESWYQAGDQSQQYWPEYRCPLWYNVFACFNQIKM